MLYGHHDYGETPDIVKHYQTGTGHQHQSLPKINDTVLETIVRDHHHLTPINIMQRMLRGAQLGAFAGLFGLFFRKAGPRAVSDRAGFQPMYYFRRVSIHMIYGALFGFGWWFLHDAIVCPHNRKTYPRTIFCYAVAGSVLATTLYNPGSFLIGAGLGALWGVTMDYKVTMQHLNPRGMQLQLTKFNQQQRQRVKRDQFEKQLSTKLVRAQQSIKYKNFIF